VLNKLIALIMNSGFEVGAKLPSETKLAGKLHVSRVTLREALKTLENLGHVVARQGSGTFVKTKFGEDISTPVSLHMAISGITMLDLIDLRRIIELEVVGFAAKRRTDADIATLSEISKQTCDRKLSPEEYIDLDSKFHIAVAAATGNRALPQIASAIRNLMRDGLIKSEAKSGRRRLYAPHHRDLTIAIANRDHRTARRIIAQHLESLEADFIQK
jgi:GntR family transcriptional repressor for pyruvate dehydrogenase complex